MMGISIINNDGVDLKSRVFFSNGINRLDSGEFQGNKQSGSVYTAKLPWRKLTNEQLKTLIEIGDEKSYNTVGLFKVPDEVLDKFHSSMGLKNRSSVNNEIEALRNDLQKLCEREEYLLFLEEIKIFLDNHYLLSTKELSIHQIATSISGLGAAAWDTERNRYPGLHIDSWDEVEVAESSGAKNRICINLGMSARGLLFVNLTLADLHQKIKRQDPNVNSIEKFSKHDLRTKFFSLYPDYPVLKVVLKPGEGYIAPTEYMIHDGTTEDSGTIDFNLVVRGFFSTRRFD
jgi:hypothetical protein